MDISAPQKHPGSAGIPAGKLYLLRLCATVIFSLFSLTTHAELPIARLQSIFPPGGQVGTSVTVKVEGADLDDATQLHFSVPGIFSERKTNTADTFVLTISSNVPPGLYEARVAGRFGISNPRFFSVGTHREFLGSNTNQTAATAMVLPLDSTVNAFASVSAADFYKFEAANAQRIFISCKGEPLDSKMRPSMILFDSEGRELLRDRREGLLDFTAPASGNYTLKIHDQQFRGGTQYSYRLTLSTQPHFDFVFPPARLPGTDRQFTAFGRDQKLPFESTIPTREESFRSVTASRPKRLADAAVLDVDVTVPFEKGPSGPQPVSIASAPAIFEQEPNSPSPQIISVPCEVQGQFFPQDDNDSFQFTAKKGDVFWIEAFSDRLGCATDPFLLVQKVRTNSTGEVSLEDVQELYDSEANIGGPLFNTSSRDPAWRLEPQEDSTYRVHIRDLFNRRADPSRLYRLSIRRESPDFQLIALIAPPPTFEKDKREAQVWSFLARRNDTVVVKVLAIRRDGFNGEIALHVGGLPADSRPSESVISEGQNATWLSISTSEKQTDWAGPIQFVGKAKAGTNEISRTAHAATILWDVPDYNNETVQSRLSQQSMLALSSDPAPFRIELTNTVWQTSQASPLTIPIRLERAAEFKQPVKIRAYVDTQNDPIKEWDVDGQAVQTTLELDLKQTKLATGPHQIFFLAQTKGQVRRVRPDEVPALETAQKAAKDDAEKKQIAERLQLRDVTATFASPVLKLIVNPAATASK